MLYSHESYGVVAFCLAKAEPFATSSGERRTMMNCTRLFLAFATAVAVCWSLFSAQSQAQIVEEEQALKFLYYAYSAYCNATALTEWNCPYCIGETEGFLTTATVYDNDTNTFGYVGYHPIYQEIIVSFRGTDSDSLKNWIVDLRFFKTDTTFLHDGTKVASGFAGAWQKLRPGIFTAVLGLVLDLPFYQVWITGHSLGGALSSLCALDLAVTQNLPINIFNFGSPRVGNLNFFADFAYFVLSSYRMTNQKDIVPHLPLEDFGFHHIATEIWEKTNTTFVICDGSGEDPTCSDSVDIALSVYDHLHYMDVPCCCGT